MALKATIDKETKVNNMTDKEKSLQTVLDKTVDGKKIFGTSFAVKKDHLNWLSASGNISRDQSYFIASKTKLLTTSIILCLKSEGKLYLEDKISKYLDISILNDLQVHSLYYRESQDCAKMPGIFDNRQDPPS